MHLPSVPKLCKGDTSKYGNSCETREAEPDTMLTLTPVSKKVSFKGHTVCFLPFSLPSQQPGKGGQGEKDEAKRSHHGKTGREICPPLHFTTSSHSSQFLNKLQKEEKDLGFVDYLGTTLKAEERIQKDKRRDTVGHSNHKHC